ncbi:hypothetical protein ACFL7M_16730, partial [Thermodesulfobacteriota bacterium]
VAIEKGFVTPDQVIKALEIQVKENLASGTHRRIGIILFKQGLITLKQIDEVIKSLEQQRFNK